MIYYIAGIDEVGRGALAGPVLSVVLIMKNNKFLHIKNLTDSKKLSSNKRLLVFNILKKYILDIKIGIANSNEIDKLNILNATLVSMKRAIIKLKILPSMILVDGNLNLSFNNINIINIIKGDLLIPIISAASIIAKIIRDRIMIKYHQIYPHYFFNQHKGYGTKLHFNQINKYGICPIHRISFLNINKLNQNSFFYD